MAVRNYFKGAQQLPRQSFDTSKVQRVLTEPTGTALAWGLVGYEEGSPQFVRIEEGQIYIEVTQQPQGDEIVARLGAPGAGPDQGFYIPLSFGCRVMLEFVGENPSNAVIVGRLWDSECSFPNSVAGVETGAAGATEPEVSVAAPLWQFLKTGSGELLAIETGSNGDILIHSAGSVEIKATGTSAIHLNGRCALGGEPLSAPTGAKVGPNGATVPGVPMVPQIPDVLPVPPPAPGIAPLPIGQDAIVRQQQHYQSNILTDIQFWLFVNGLFAHPLIGPVLIGAGIVVPVHVNSLAAGTPSQHTASD